MNEIEDRDRIAIAESTETPGVAPPAAGSDQTSPSQQPHEKVRNAIAEWTVTILLLLWGTTTLLQAFVIPTESMDPTLMVGDYLLVDKLTYAPPGFVSKYLLPYHEPQHGDIIVFRYPLDISKNYVKRVIGVPGDHIRIVNTKIFRNGRQIYEPYAHFTKHIPDSYRDVFPPDPSVNWDERARDMLAGHVVNGELVVPVDSYFAMGDNRDNSEDSRYWGFVPRANIIGKPLLIYWSYQTGTPDLTATSAGSMLRHFGDIATHFFTKTRWNRTLTLIHGYHSND